jgi:hypothetical protein
MATYLSVKTYTFYIYYACIIISQHNAVNFNMGTLWYSYGKCYKTPPNDLKLLGFIPGYLLYLATREVNCQPYNAI